MPANTIPPFGAGLRPHHYKDWQKAAPHLWAEIMADNYLHQKGGPGLHHLEKALGDRPRVMHGVGLNVAGTEPLDLGYLRSLRELVGRFAPTVVSDHLCFTSADGRNVFDLLPFPYSEANLKHVAARVQEVQDFLGTRLVLENLSRYVAFATDEMTECTFLSELARRTGCGLLLDVNNVMVTARNLGGDPFAEIACLEPWMVAQYHVAGHTEHDGYWHDTHDKPVKKEVWDLLFACLDRLGHKPVILERDDDSAFETLVREITENVVGGSARAPHPAPAPQPARAPAPPQAPISETPVGDTHLAHTCPLASVQREFVHAVQSAPWHSLAEIVGSSGVLPLRAATLGNLDIYRMGFYARLTQVLGESLLADLSDRFGKDKVELWLGKFFVARGGRGRLLHEALSGFAEYLEDSGVEAAHRGARDLVRFCLLRWEVLVGSDPHHARPGVGTSLEDIVLAESARLVTMGFEQERHASAPGSLADTFLLFKESPTLLTTITVPPALVPIAQRLAQGFSLAAALPQEDEVQEHTDESILQTWLSDLFSRGVFAVAGPHSSKQGA